MPKKINSLLKQFFVYKTECSNSIDEIMTALKNPQIQIANIKPECKSFNTLKMIVSINAIKDFAFNTIKQLLERESKLILKATKNTLKSNKALIED